MPSEQNVYVAPLKGSRIGATREKAGMWLFSGEGKTSGSRTPHLTIGTQIIDLEQLMWECDTPYTQFLPRVSCAIISPCYFVATAIGEPNAIMSASFKITSKQFPTPGPILTTIDGSPENTASRLSTYKAIKVIVSSSVGGRRKGNIAYHWMCLVEVGLLWQPQG